MERSDGRLNDDGRATPRGQNGEGIGIPANGVRMKPWLLPILLVLPAQAAALEPLVVRVQINTTERHCRFAGGVPVITPRAIQRIDVTGDGTDDWVVDSRHVLCRRDGKGIRFGNDRHLLVATGSGNRSFGLDATSWTLSSDAIPTFSLHTPIGGYCEDSFGQGCELKYRWQDGAFVRLSAVPARVQ
jgi:hypothetical protein